MTKESKDAAAEREEESLKGFLSRLAGEGAESVKLYRRNRGGHREYLSALTLDQVSEEAIQEQMGGGRYTAQLINSEGLYIPGGSTTFTIAGALKPWPPPEPEVEQLDPEKLLELARAQQPPPQDRTEIYTALITAVSSILAPIIAGAMARSENQPVGDFDNFLKAFKLGQGAADREGGYETVLRELGAPTLKLLQTGIEQGKVPAVPAPAAAAAPAAPEVAPHAPPWVSEIRPYVPVLMRLADEGRNPGLYADLILDQASETILPLLDSWGVDGLLAALEGYFPDLSPRAGWIRSLLEEMLEVEGTEDVEDGAEIDQELPAAGEVEDPETPAG